MRHLLEVDDLTAEELLAVVDLADRLKADRPRPGHGAASPWGDALAGRSVALIFEKPSTRTRVSFEVGVRELGGHPVVLTAQQIQLGRGETVADTARVLSRYVHAVVIRTFGQDRLVDLARAGGIPVVNALTDTHHPCQAVADLQTIREQRGRLAGLKLAYLGDGNNMAHSLMQAGAMAGMHVAVAAPEGHQPDADVAARARELADAHGGAITTTTDPAEALADADVLYTDVWTSMGQEDEAAARTEAVFGPYRIDAAALARAADGAIVMHCLPAHRGEEITAEVLEGPASVVFDQAENRLHAQKALLVTLLGGA